MIKVNNIIVDSSNYSITEEALDVLGEVVKLLLKLNYNVVAKYDDCGIYVVEFESNDLSLDVPFPIWQRECEEEE